jgi:hypothetical protein
MMTDGYDKIRVKGTVHQFSEFERNEMAMLFGLVTAAYIAKQNGYSFQDFMRAVLLSWETKKSDPAVRQGA